MKSKKYIFKPLDNIFLCYLFPFLLFFLPVDIALFGPHFEINILLIVLITNTVSISVYLLARLIYPIRYEVDSASIVKYRYKKVIFKIQISDIEAIFIKKGKWYSFFPSILCAALGGMPDDTKMTNLSIVFKKCDILKAEKREFIGLSLKQEGYKDHFEMNEVLSLRKCRKICKKTGHKPIFV